MGNFRGRRQPVNGDFNGNYIRTVCCFTEQPQEWVNFIKGEKEHLIPLLNLFDHAAIGVQAFRPAGDIGGEFQGLDGCLRQGLNKTVDVLHIQRGLIKVDLMIMDIDAALEHLEEVAFGSAVDFQTDNRQVGTLL